MDSTRLNYFACFGSFFGSVCKKEPLLSKLLLKGGPFARGHPAYPAWYYALRTFEAGLQAVLRHAASGCDRRRQSGIRPHRRRRRAWFRPVMPGEIRAASRTRATPRSLLCPILPLRITCSTQISQLPSNNAVAQPTRGCKISAALPLGIASHACFKVRAKRLHAEYN